MKKLLFILLILIVIACKKEKAKEPCWDCSVQIDTIIGASYEGHWTQTYSNFIVCHSLNGVQYEGALRYMYPYGFVFWDTMIVIDESINFKIKKHLQCMAVMR